MLKGITVVKNPTFEVPPTSEKLSPSIAVAKGCGGFKDCIFGQPANSWADVPLHTDISTAEGSLRVPLEPLVGDYVDKAHRQWGSPAVVLRSRRWYERFIKCTAPTRNRTWQFACADRQRGGRDGNAAQFKREDACWQDAIEDMQVYEHIAPAAFRDYERLFPRAKGSRAILVDFGAREFASSTSALARNYGAFGVSFDEIYAAEAQSDRVVDFADDAVKASGSNAQDADLARGLGNAKLEVLVALVQTQGGKAVPFGPRSKGLRVRTLDPVAWLRENVKKEDFVVVKMDIERAEYTVLPHM